MTDPSSNPVSKWKGPQPTVDEALELADSGLPGSTHAVSYPRALRALAAEVRRLRGSDETTAWQPIKTAPLDKTVLLWWIGAGAPKAAHTSVIGQVSSHEPGQWWNGQRAEYADLSLVTHWMLLPSAPVEMETPLSAAAHARAVEKMNRWDVTPEEPKAHLATDCHYPDCIGDCQVICKAQARHSSPEKAGAPPTLKRYALSVGGMVPHAEGPWVRYSENGNG